MKFEKISVFCLSILATLVLKAQVGNEQQPPLTAYSKFDFIPGEKLIAIENFSSAAVGELPISWNASGKGEVMTLNNHTGKWLRLFQHTTYLWGGKKSLGENYTIEFDLLYYYMPSSKNYVMPGWQFGLFNSNNTDPTANEFLRYRSAINSFETRFEYSSNIMARFENTVKNVSVFKSDKLQLEPPAVVVNKLKHISIQVQQSRFRLWIDQTKVFDIPRGVTTTTPLNGLYFQMEGSNYKDEEIGLFLSNIKIATGIPDSRNKLLKDGSFITTGILFDVNSARIQPASYPVLKELATVLQDNPNLKIRITGHTDKDGNAAANQLLSEQRAKAVKTFLVNEFNIDSDRLQTAGKGQTQPLSKDLTEAGKAMNRRVEFTRL